MLLLVIIAAVLMIALAAFASAGSQNRRLRLGVRNHATREQLPRLSAADTGR
jgi:hypothetical protein